MKTPYTRTGGIAPKTNPLTHEEKTILRQAEFIIPPRGLGDVIEGLIKPVAQVLGLSCLDSTGQLKPDSPCARRRDALNRKTGLSYRNLR